MPPYADAKAAAQPAPGGILDLRAVLAEPIDWQYKAFPILDEPVLIGAAGTQAWNALRPPFSTPVMVLKERAIQHNIDVMARYCSAHMVSLAPHVKTPLSPQIADRQLAAGAWGLTVANVHQARVLRCVGARRLFFANELVDAASASWLARQLDEDQTLEVYCLVDSERGAELLDRNLAAAGLRSQVNVLIELGIVGARCGCRSVDEGWRLAQSVARLARLRLVGVEAYENLFPTGTIDETTARVDALFNGVRELAMRLDDAHLLREASEILVSGGGSMWFDRAAAGLTGGWTLSRPVRTVIRAGSYVTHDGAQYKDLSPLDGRSTGPPELQQGLELWASVISRPEPDLAILNLGKRDAAHDRGFPMPFSARGQDGPWAVPTATHAILSLNDQHARLKLPLDSPLAVGDLVGCYVSHPCTSFDKWRLVPLVDDQYDVLGAVKSYL